MHSGHQRLGRQDGPPVLHLRGGRLSQSAAPFAPLVSRLHIPLQVGLGTARGGHGTRPVCFPGQKRSTVAQLFEILRKNAPSLHLASTRLCAHVPIRAGLAW